MQRTGLTLARLAPLCASLVFAACGGSSSLPPAVDAGPVDAGTVVTDAGPHDAGHVDAGHPDAGHDAGPVDAGHDAGTGDAGEDAGHDAGNPDSGFVDAGTPDSGPIDAGPRDAGYIDAGTGPCPESDFEFCQNLNTTCGSATGNNVCGEPKNVNCGVCPTALDTGDFAIIGVTIDNFVIYQNVATGAYSAVSTASGSTPISIGVPAGATTAIVSAGTVFIWIWE
jgi:hypothetical protein